MDEPFESFLTEVLALEGEDENAIREGVRVALADYEQVFRAQEVNKRMMVQGGSRLRFWISGHSSRSALENILFALVKVVLGHVRTGLLQPPLDG